MSDHVLEHQTGVEQSEPNPPKGNDLLEAVALALDARGSEETAGAEGIELIVSGIATTSGVDDVEHYDWQTIAMLPVNGTIFAWIAEELAALGVQSPLVTIGQTVVALGIKGGEGGQPGWDGEVTNDQDARHRAVHHIGCHCNGYTITAEDAAARVRDLKLQ